MARSIVVSAKRLAANRRNAQKAGRPKGTFSQKTIDRTAALEHFRQRTANVTDILFDSQFSLAKGAQYLFRIDKEFIKTGEGKNGDRGYWRNKKPVIVTSPEEMRNFLEEEFCNGDAEDEYDESAAYYFLSARDPSNMAIDSLLDRTHGRSKSEIDVNIKVPRPIYGGESVKSLPQAQKQLPPKKMKAVILSPKIHENNTENN